MIDTNQLSAFVSAFRVETEKESISQRYTFNKETEQKLNHIGWKSRSTSIF